VTVVCAQDDPVYNKKDGVIIDQIVVTSDRMQDYVENYPEAVQVIDMEEMEKSGYMALGDVLNTLSGIEVNESSGSIGARVMIRGNSDVLVLVDGRSLNFSKAGYVDLNIVPFTSIKKVEVFKPPVPVWLGGGVAGGVVNIITKGPVKKDIQQKEHQVRISGGSYGLTSVNYAYAAQMEKDYFRGGITAGHVDGKRPNSDRDAANLNLKWRHGADANNATTCNYNLYFKNNGSSGPEDNETPDARQRYIRTSLDIDQKVLLDYMGVFEAKLFSDYEDLKDKSQSGFISRLNVYKAGVNTKIQFLPIHDWGILAGIDLNQDGSEHTISGWHRRDIVSGFFQVDKSWGKWTGTLGARSDYYSDYGVYGNPKAGISYGFNDSMVVRFNMGYKVVCPSFSQLYQTTHGSVDQVKGNADLDPERFWQKSINMEYRIRKNSVMECTFFRDEIKDYITYVRGADLVYSPVNVDKVYRQGIEAGWQEEWYSFFETRIDYIFLDTEDRKTDKHLIYNPEYIIKFRIVNKFPKGIRFETCIKYSSKAYSDMINSQAMDLNQYSTMDICFIKTFIKLKGQFFITIKNIWDEDYESHRGYPDDGVRVETGIKINF